MKFVSVLTLAPGVDNAKKAFEVFGKVGSGEGTEALYAAADGKTFIAILEEDTLDMTTSATYGPFWESATVMPVVPVDAGWMEAMQKALDAWG